VKSTRWCRLWFILADVCDLLDLGNPAKTAERLDPDEKGITSSDTLGGKQQMLIISEIAFALKSATT
jgi:prophage antirepressor-like protein